MTGLIVDNVSLQAAIVEYLARDQDTTLIARVPTFIQLFEAKMNRDLFVRQMETRATAVTDPALTTEPQYVALPADFQAMRRLSIVSTVDTSGNMHHRKKSFDYITPTQLDEFKQERSQSVGGFDEGSFGGSTGFGGSGRHFYTIFGNEIELYPTPHAATTLEMVYRQNLPPLATNTTNWLLSLAPDAYLYGTLLESAPYIKQDGRIAVWGAGMTSALNDLNSMSSNLVFAAGPMQVRASRGRGGNRSFADGGLR